MEASVEQIFGGRLWRTSGGRSGGRGSSPGGERRTALTVRASYKSSHGPLRCPWPASLSVIATSVPDALADASRGHFAISQKNEFL